MPVAVLHPKIAFRDLSNRAEANDDGIEPKRVNHRAQPQRRAYLPPYARLRAALDLAEGPDQSVLVSCEGLKSCIRLLLRGVEVDEEWYRTEYADVSDAISKGVFRSAKQHFVESGYFEGRRPGRVAVDENWYSRAYPDVSESVEFGEIGSCQEHFDRYGEREGRFPSED